MSNMNQFKLHPSVIYNIIREQAGSPEKALAELVMNSIDAGSTKIELNITAHGFSIKDNGKGFSSLDEIESFFGTFGTPHAQGDGAAVYGQFRIGRGQAFSLAKTEWRSGLFGMTVDLGNVGKKDVHGYELHEYTENFEGCLIEGEFYQKLNIFEELQSPLVFDTQFQDELEKFKKNPFDVFSKNTFFARLAKNLIMLGVETHLNGVLVSNMLADTQPIGSDENADHYILDKVKANGLILLNKGIYITTLPYSCPSIIDFKVSPDLNMARNQINAKCKIYNQSRLKHHTLLTDGYISNKAWAKKVGMVIASNMVCALNQFDKELVDHLTTEQFKGFLKEFEITAISKKKAENISILDALELSKTHSVHINTLNQNEDLKASHLKALVKQLNEADADGYVIASHRTNLIASTSRFQSDEFETPLHNYCKKFGLLDLVQHLKTHNFYEDYEELENDKVYKTKIRTVKAPPKKEESSLILIKRQLMEKGVNIEISDARLKKNESALKIFDERLQSFILSFKEMVEDVIDDIPETLILNIAPYITPIVVDHYDNSLTNSDVVKCNGEYYLIIGDEAFARGDWGASLIHFLLKHEGKGSDDIYENHEFLKEFHDSLDDIDLGDLYDSLEGIGIEVTQQLTKRPMRSTRKAPMKEIRDAWSSVFAVDSSLLKDDEVAEKWEKFKSINVT